MTVLRITDTSTKAEVAEALTHCCRTAIRAPHVISRDADRPSEWDRLHERIDRLLCEWEAAAV